MPLHEVRDALGHSSVTMTNAYLRGRVNSLEGAFERLAQHRARKLSKVVSSR